MVGFVTLKWCDARLRSHGGATQHIQRALCWLTWCILMILGYSHSGYDTPRTILRMKLDYVCVGHACLVIQRACVCFKARMPKCKRPIIHQLEQPTCRTSIKPATIFVEPVGRMPMIALWWIQLKVFIRSRSLPQGDDYQTHCNKWEGWRKCWQKLLPLKTVQPRLTKVTFSFFFFSKMRSSSF